MQLKLTKNDVLEECRALIGLALPVIGTQLANIGLSVTDVIMAGHIGVKDLAAVAVGNSLAYPVVYTFMGVLVAIGPIVAQLYGGGRIGEIGEKVRQGFWVAALLSLIGILTIFNIQPIMVWVNVEPELIPLTARYIKALSWGLPFFMAYFVLRFFNEGLGLNRPAFLVSCLAVPFNILCNYTLMYGHFGFPKMGAVGSGHATAAVWVLMFSSLALWTFLRREYQTYNLRGISLPKWEVLKEIFSVGLPSGVSIGMEISMFAIIALLISSLGSQMVAAHQIALNIASIAYMAALGLSIALSTRVGHAAGRGSLNDVKKSGIVGISVAGLTSLAMAIIIYCFPYFLAGLYTREHDVRQLAAQLLFFAALFQLSDGLQVSSMGALRGLKDTRAPMFLNIFAYWVIGLPLGWYLGMYRNMGAKGFWVGLIAGLTAGAVFHSIRFFALTRSRDLLKKKSNPN